MAQPRAQAAKDPAEGAEASQETAGARQTPEGDQKAVAGSEGVTRRYRATHSIGRSRRGDIFDAADDDPRVLSGYVERLDDDVPDEVQAALDS